jgi:hypothetical protein
MAKSGTIAAVLGTNAALKAAVANSDPKTATLGSVVADAMAAHPTPVTVVIDTNARKVYVMDVAVAAVNTAIYNMLDDASGDIDNNVEVLTPSDATKRSTPFTRDATKSTALSDNLIAALAPVSPAFSVASLISKIEDAAASEGKAALIEVNQVTGVIRFAVNEPASITGAGVAAAMPDANTLAEFSQTLESSAGGPKDKFE